LFACQPRKSIGTVVVDPNGFRHRRRRWPRNRVPRRTKDGGAHYGEDEEYYPPNKPVNRPEQDYGAARQLAPRPPRTLFAPISRVGLVQVMARALLC
jgi:hypothetical protein